MPNPSSRKIGLILSSLHGGGAEKMMLNLASEFVKQDIQVDLILSTKSGDYLDQVPSKVRIVNLEAHRLAKSLIPLIKHLRSNEYDCILSTGTGMNIISCLVKHFSQMDARLVIRVQNTVSRSVKTGSRPEHWLLPYFVKLLFPRADRVVAISEGVKADLTNFTSVDSSKVDVIYNPVVTDELYNLANKQPNHKWFEEIEDSIIIGAGRLIPEKNFETLIRAFNNFLNENQGRLIILGKGPEKSALVQLTQKLDIDEMVDFAGFVDNPYAFMNHADLFAQSPATEGFGNVLVEAMACGTPVVSTDCPHGPAEILNFGQYGPLVPVGDDIALAKAIEWVLERPLPSKYLQKRATKFSSRKIKHEYDQVLFQIDTEYNA